MNIDYLTCNNKKMSIEMILVEAKNIVLIYIRICGKIKLCFTHGYEHASFEDQFDINRMLRLNVEDLHNESIKEQKFD